MNLIIVQGTQNGTKIEVGQAVFELLTGLISKAVKTYFDRKAVKTGQNWFKPVKTWSKPKTQEHVPRVMKEPCYM